MSRIIRIPDQAPRPEEVSEPQESPYVLELNEPKKTPHKRCTDIIPPEREEIEIRVIAEKPRPKFFRRQELLRMGAVATVIVLALNLGQVYFKAQEAKDRVLDAAYAGYETLLDIDTSDLEESNSAFEQAVLQFTIAENLVWYLTDDERGLITSNKYTKTLDSLLNTGSAVSSAGSLFSQFAQEVTEVTGGLFQEGSEGKESLTQALNEAYTAYLVPAQEELKRAEIYLQEVDFKILPDEYEEQAQLATTQIAEINAFLEKLTQNFPTVLQLLGDELPQSYMILLENNSELRPGGGFIGSFLTLDLNDGYIDNMKFHDIYEWDGPFNEYIEPPVEEISYLTCCWGLRDANYSPDYAVSSEAVTWLFEREGGHTIDHVLMVDLSFVRDILEAIGPIYIENLGELNSENFELVVSYIVESKLSGIENPKAILEDIIPAVQEKLLSGENIIAVVEALINNAKSKHLAAYSANENHQDLWRNLGLDAEAYTPGPNEDYLMVTVSGIGGNKTDFYTLQNINHQTLLSKDGSILDKITITRNHTYNENTAAWQRDVLESFGFAAPEGDVENILGEGDNVAGIRIYIPQEAQFLASSEEVEILYDEDLGLPYFYFILTTPPGEESQIEITYTLPFSLEFEPVDDYFLYVDKQPGLSNTTFTKEIVAPNLNNYALYPEDLEEQEDLSWHFETSLDSNLHLGGVFGP